MEYNEARERAEKAKHPFYIVGDDAANHRVMDIDIVTFQVAVNLDLRHDREFSSARPLHELPLLMRMYNLLGGSIVIKTDWAPYCQRKKGFTKESLKNELERLDNAYRIPREKDYIYIFREIYGMGHDTKLFKMIHEMATQWSALEKRLTAKVTPAIAAAAAERGLPINPVDIDQAVNGAMTPADIEAIVRIAMPDEALLDHIDLGEIDLTGVPDIGKSAGPVAGPATPAGLEEPAAPARAATAPPAAVTKEKGKPGPKPKGKPTATATATAAPEVDAGGFDAAALIEYLVGANIPETTAHVFAAALSETDGMMPASEWAKVPKCGNKAGAKLRESLMRLFGEFQAAQMAKA